MKSKTYSGMPVDERRQVLSQIGEQAAPDPDRLAELAYDALPERTRKALRRF